MVDMITGPVIVEEVYSYHVRRDIQGRPYDPLRAYYTTGDSPHVQYKNVACITEIWHDEKGWERRIINEDNLKKYFTLYDLGQNEEGDHIFKAVCKDEINITPITFRGHLRLQPVNELTPSKDDDYWLTIDYETRIK